MLIGLWIHVPDVLLIVPLRVMRSDVGLELQSSMPFERQPNHQHKQQHQHHRINDARTQNSVSCANSTTPLDAYADTKRSGILDEDDTIVAKEERPDDVKVCLDISDEFVLLDAELTPGDISVVVDIGIEQVAIWVNRVVPIVNPPDDVRQVVKILPLAATPHIAHTVSLVFAVGFNEISEELIIAA